MFNKLKTLNKGSDSIVELSNILLFTKPLSSYYPGICNSSISGSSSDLDLEKPKETFVDSNR
jgi:hypothetical protein